MRLGPVLFISICVSLAGTAFLTFGAGGHGNHAAVLGEPPSPELQRARAYNRKLEAVVYRQVSRAERLERKLRRARYVLRNRYRPPMTHLISVAASAFGQSPSTLIRKANCETGGTFSPYAYNESSGASGLFQFLRSTWRSTPLAGQSPFDPFASALAAAWMHRQGRGGEWVCR